MRIGYDNFFQNKDTIKKVEDTYTQAANEFEKKVSGGSKKTQKGNSTLNSVNVNLDSSQRQQMEGYNIIGTIEIPKVDLKCAILNETTKRALEIAAAGRT